MKVIKQSATSVIRIFIETELPEIQELRFGFFQGGRKIAEYSSGDENVTTEEGVVDITIPAETCDLFAPGIYAIEAQALLASGNVVPARSALYGRVDPSGFLKEEFANE